MPSPKQGVSRDGQPMHYAVGAVIKQEGKFLLIDRAIFPYGFAGVAGHVDEGESPEEAVRREIREEMGLTLDGNVLIHEEELAWTYPCSRGIFVHYWHMYACSVSGMPAPSIREVKSFGWFGLEEVKNLPLEPIWEYVMKTLKLL